MAYEDFTRAEGVSVRAARRRVGDPLPSGGSYEFTQHDYQPMTDARHGCPGREMGLAAIVSGSRLSGTGSDWLRSWLVSRWSPVATVALSRQPTRRLPPF